jgi:CBS domain-containing protein
MNVDAIMTRAPLSLRVEATLEEALALMDGHAIRHLPITDAGRVVGILSDRNLLEVTGGPGPGRGNGATPGATRRVGELMHAPVVTVRPEDRLVTAAVEIAVRTIGCLPVVQAGGLVGMLTEMDLLAAFVRESRAGRLSGDHDPAVAKLMTADPHTVAPDTPLAVALASCRARHFRHLPVVDASGHLIAILSDRDLRRAVGQGCTASDPISTFMRREVATIAPGDPVTAAAARMTERKISGLPVVEDGALVGILSSTDLVEHCMNTLWEPS